MSDAERVLRKYGQHFGQSLAFHGVFLGHKCKRVDHNGALNDEECTCGFDAALRAPQQPPSGDVREAADKEWITTCAAVLGLSSGLMCPTGPDGIRAMVESVRAEERERCAERLEQHAARQRAKNKCARAAIYEKGADLIRALAPKERNDG